VSRLLLAATLAVLAAQAHAESLSLSPAAVALRGHAGQSTTQTLTLRNGTSADLAFHLAARDVVVNEGVRRFVDPIELPDSIAATAVFSASDVMIPSGQARSVDVTLTMTPAARHRAVVVLFQGATRLEQGGRGTILSLGTLLTFTVSDGVVLEPSALELQPPTTASPLMIALALHNGGQEPAVARGVAVILSADGRIVGRALFPARRLLPGENVTVSTDYGGQMPAGRYRVLATLDSEGHALTRAADLVVP
jgi:hypothetical protein